jgi:hypothetical protein
LTLKIEHDILYGNSIFRVIFYFEGEKDEKEEFWAGNTGNGTGIRNDGCWL